MDTFLFLYIFHTNTHTETRTHTHTHTHTAHAHTQGCAARILTGGLHIQLKAETLLLAYSTEEKWSQGSPAGVLNSQFSI